MCFLFVSVRTRRYVLEEPGFHRLPIIFCARIFTRHFLFIWHFIWQLGILLGNRHFTRNFTRHSAFLPGD